MADGQIDWKVKLFRLNYDEREVAAVKAVLESDWLTMGQRTMDFEEAFGTMLGQGARCLAVANGTAALHISVLASGIGPGDEVIVPSLTFIADLNVVRVAGADVVLADITSKTDWAMDPADIERKITKKTKAVLIVHYAGYACDMDSIVDICNRNNLLLIEDCAHSPGGEYKGRKLGTFGTFSAWSFFSNKNITVGEGGMVATRDALAWQKCKNLRSHGMTVASFDRLKGRAITYDVLEPGFNYRMDEIHAALGLVQLDKLASANALRGKITERYFSHLDGLAGLSLPFRHFDRGLPTWHIMPLLLADGIDRQAIVDSLKAEGIQTSVHYPAIQNFTAYKGHVSPTALSQYVSDHELTLPIFPTMSDSEVDLVSDALIRALAREQGKA
ncbi:MAG: DegT/DnrJ/EryC1/StrS family aminotransferase [Spirochaetota bacterium]